MSGLLEKDLEYIREAISKYRQIEKVILFGSRAMGNYKNGSDVDLALVGDKLTRSVVQELSEALNEEYPLPYFFDVLDYGEIKNTELKEHIDNFGKCIYETDR